MDMHSTRIGADKSAQAQKFGISMKKRLHWASLVRALHDLITAHARFLRN